MKQLRQFIRKILLTEACEGATSKIQQGLDEIEKSNLFVEVEQDGDQGYVVILRQVWDTSDRVVGMFEVITRPDCQPTYVTQWTEINPLFANTGVGAVLYDVAIEYATKLGSYLTCDRVSVTPEAKRMWRYYDLSDDYEELQLDTLGGDFTPLESDDCKQTIFHDDTQIPWNAKADTYQKEFMASPFTKAYRKKRITTIPCLGDRYSEE
jgi:GNAT superfamily N-acetyltransferase